MLLKMSSCRALRPVLLDRYYSPRFLATAVARLCIYKTTYIDPCAGTNALFDVLPSPKQRYDIEDGKDFFEATRATFGDAPLTFVMNPPFSLPGQRNGVVLFLNHACACMRDGEHILCVAPQTMRKWLNIAKVKPELHLIREHVLRKGVDFEHKGKKRRVSIVLQLWKRCPQPRVEPRMLSDLPDFVVSYRKPGNFYVKVWGVLKKIGAIGFDTPVIDGKRLRTSVGTLALSGKGGTAIAVIVHKNFNKVKARFIEMYQDGEWREYMAYKCAGNNNPMVTRMQIYTLYEKGIAYLRKERHGVEQHYV